MTDSDMGQAADSFDLPVREKARVVDSVHLWLPFVVNLHCQPGWPAALRTINKTNKPCRWFRSSPLLISSFQACLCAVYSCSSLLLVFFFFNGTSQGYFLPLQDRRGRDTTWLCFLGTRRSLL